MLHFKSKIISLLLCFCVISGLLIPALSQADEVNSWGGDSGSIDAGKAAAQRAAAAKRAAKKHKKAEGGELMTPQRTLTLKRGKRLQDNWPAGCAESELFSDSKILFFIRLFSCTNRLATNL